MMPKRPPAGTLRRMQTLLALADLQAQKKMQPVNAHRSKAAAIKAGIDTLARLRKDMIGATSNSAAGDVSASDMAYRVARAEDIRKMVADCYLELAECEARTATLVAEASRATARAEVLKKLIARAGRRSRRD